MGTFSCFFCFCFCFCTYDIASTSRSNVKEILGYQHDSMWQAAKIILEHVRTTRKKWPHTKLSYYILVFCLILCYLRHPPLEGCTFNGLLYSTSATIWEHWKCSWFNCWNILSDIMWNISYPRCIFTKGTFPTQGNLCPENVVICSSLMWFLCTN